MKIKQNLLKYYKIFIELNINNAKIKIYLDEEYKNINEVKNIISEIKNKYFLNVYSLSSEHKSLPRPHVLNTINMFKLAYTELGMSPNKTMPLEENLYMERFITYPRTETTKYSPSFDFKNNLKKFEGDETFGKEVKELIFDFDNFNLITPSRMPNEGELRGKQNDLFKLICNYYFATLSPSLEYDKINYKFQIGNKIYNAETSFIEDIKFLKLIPFKNKNFIDSKNKLKENIDYQILNASFEERKINDYITEAELIEEMEKKHIGTDASMIVHIDNIERRGYVRVDDKRRLIPTKLGKALIEALESVEPDIVLPENRGKIEEFISQLADGKKNYDEVLDYALQFYKKKFYSINEKVDLLYEVFAKYFD